MIDAYKIGITLALEDGVSAGLKQIQNSLSMTDKVVQHSTQNLQKYSELGRAAAKPSAGRIDAFAGTKARASFIEPTEDLKPQTGGVPAGPGVQEQAWPIAITRNYAPLSEVPAEDKNSSFQSADKTYPDFEGLGRKLSALLASGSMPIREQGGVTSLVQNLPQPEGKLKEPDYSSIAVSIAAPPSLDPVPTKEVSTNDALERWVHFGSLAKPSAPAVSTGSDHAGATTPQIIEQTAPVRSASMPTPLPLYVPAQVASVAPVIQARPAKEAALSSGRMFSSESAHQQDVTTRMDNSVSEHGELIIDGEVLGRWMMDRLTKAMIRPPAGMTGFDTRMTPLYAGPPIGV